MSNLSAINKASFKLFNSFPYMLQLLENIGLKQLYEKKKLWSEI